MDYPLNVAVIWHMHQPYYKDLKSGHYLLPWVRLHATKDYYDMAAILDEFPGIRQTFNVVPSLLAQVEDYASGEAIDTFLEVSKKPAAELSQPEKAFILKNFFLANWETMIKPFPRYFEILHKRGTHCSSEEIEKATAFFSVDDFRDLQVLFNLCWFDPSFLKEDPFLEGLKAKGRGYTEEEKGRLLEKQREITGRVIPNYKRLAEEGRIELTTTPFYHPILPLLCDTEVARKAMPHTNLPSKPFRHPEDAVTQVRRGVEFHKKTFGSAPAGMWPSEGSVSKEALGIIAKEGIKWVATDEEILAASAGRGIKRSGKGVPEDPEFLYKPYRFKTKHGDISMIFRDHQLSDLIGFVYSSWDPKAAAADFMHKLHDIRHALGAKNKKGNHVVPVILDGENCWEHYKNDGWDFLTALYGMVEADPLINMVTVSEHLEKHPPKARLEKVFPGSWINHNFRIWIGHDEDNLAWDYLKTARDDLTAAQESDEIAGEALKTAWEHIYIAEGSDWCWWYGDEHSTDNDADFDALFRKNLQNIYELMGKTVPSALFKPIIQVGKDVLPVYEPSAYINPTIDGEVSDYFEWIGAAVIELERIGGAMHKASHVLSHLYFGFNKENIFFRADLTTDVEPDEVAKITVKLVLHSPVSLSVTMEEVGSCAKGSLEIEGKGSPQTVRAKFEDILEMELPLTYLDFKDQALKEKREIECYVSVHRDGGEIERWPSAGYFVVKVPGDDFHSKTWNVYA